ncbi:hypothetical protein HanRHA438_Chr10g0432471 [Helianthus annuus]|nr:hypothetical protein HanRHA438_Chr10g0432471 [Helianthus annuus]
MPNLKKLDFVYFQFIHQFQHIYHYCTCSLASNSYAYTTCSSSHSYYRKSNSYAHTTCSSSHRLLPENGCINIVRSTIGDTPHILIHQTPFLFVATVSNCCNGF